MRGEDFSKSRRLGPFKGNLYLLLYFLFYVFTCVWVYIYTPCGSLWSSEVSNSLELSYRWKLEFETGSPLAQADLRFTVYLRLATVSSNLLFQPL